MAVARVAQERTQQRARPGRKKVRAHPNGRDARRGIDHDSRHACFAGPILVVVGGNLFVRGLLRARCSWSHRHTSPQRHCTAQRIARLALAATSCLRRRLHPAKTGRSPLSSIRSNLSLRHACHPSWRRAFQRRHSEPIRTSGDSASQRNARPPVKRPSDLQDLAIPSQVLSRPFAMRRGRPRTQSSLR